MLISHYACTSSPACECECRLGVYNFVYDFMAIPIVIIIKLNRIVIVLGALASANLHDSCPTQNAIKSNTLVVRCINRDREGKRDREKKTHFLENKHSQYERISCIYRFEAMANTTAHIWFHFKLNRFVTYTFAFTYLALANFERQNEM